MNRFGDMAYEEFKQQMNEFKMSANVETINLDRHTFLVSSNVAIPGAVDWHSKGYVIPIKYQGQCGSRQAFFATDFVDMRAQNETGLRNAIAINALQDSFRFCKLDIYKEPDCSSTELDHGVLAVDYDKSRS
ncbi:unnamed protein product [Adineta steineri]|uniref:Peptidase C1A papain C-terminal domain-containing protein n=1 Tax=Adineta steineri TaxID=433720 RepID=A0A816A338_9BILA|nr:unnamed protein product [Adineta steineri]CAF1679528.1 unnamed protein product [Adineta steineri]